MNVIQQFLNPPEPSMLEWIESFSPLRTYTISWWEKTKEETNWRKREYKVRARNAPLELVKDIDYMSKPCVTTGLAVASFKDSIYG